MHVSNELCVEVHYYFIKQKEKKGREKDFVKEREKIK